MTDLNKNVRVKFSDEGSDKVRKDFKDVGKDADELDKREISPKLKLGGTPEFNKQLKNSRDELLKVGKLSESAKLGLDARPFNEAIKKFNAEWQKTAGRRKDVELGLEKKRFDSGMDDVGRRLGDISKRLHDARVGLDDKAAILKLDNFQHRLDMVGKKTDSAHIGIDGVERSILDLRKLDLELDKFGAKSVTATAKTRSSFRNLIGVLGGDAWSNLVKKIGGFFGGGGAGAAGMAEAGESGGSAFTGAFGQQLKIEGIAALVTWLLSMAPALVPYALGLGVGIGGAVIAGLTHAGLKKKFTDTMHGIMADLGKDTEPMVKPLEGMLSKLGAFVKSQGPALSQMFKASLPFLKSFVTIMEQFGKQAIPVITNAMKEIKPQIPAIVAGFMSLLQGLLMFIKVMGPGIKPAVQVFRTSMSVVKAMLIGVAALADGLAYAFDFMIGVFTGHSRAMTNVAHAIEAAWNQVFSFSKKIFGDIEKFFKKIWASIWSWGDNQVTRFSKDVERGWNNTYAFAKNIFGKVEAFFKNIWSNMWTWGSSQVRHFVTTIQNLWNDIVGDAKNVFGKIENTIKRIWQDVWNWCAHTLRTAGQDIHNLWNDMLNDAKSLFNKIETTVKNIWQELWNWAKNTLRNIGHDIHVLWTDMLNDASDMFNKIRTTVKNIWSDVWNWAKTTLRNIGHDIHVLWNDMLQDASDIFSKIRSKIEDIWSDVWNWAKTRLRDAGHDIHALWNDMLTDAGAIFHNIEHKIEGIWGAIWSWLKQKATQGVNDIKGILNTLGNVWNKVATAIHLPSSLHFPKLQGGGVVGGSATGDSAAPKQFASGGKVGGQGRGDRHHVLVESGETIVPSRVSGKYANAFKADGIPGYQNGGFVGSMGLMQYTNGGTPGTGKPSGGGDPKVVHQQPTGVQSRLQGNTGGDGSSKLSLSKLLKDVKDDAIQAAFKPVEGLVSTGTKALIAEGGFGELMGEAAQSLMSGILNKLEAAANKAESGGASGQEIATYAKKFKGHRYVLGGPGDYQTKHSPPFGAWDCAGFVSQMYDHFGLGSPTAGINVTALRNWSHNKKDKKPTIGGMAFFVGADGSPSHPGHVGLVTGNNEMINAEDEAMGTRMATLSGALWFATPPGGFGGNGKFSGKGGTAVYSYLLNNLFEGHKIAAAGATASIWGESGWNPESQGTGGRGLIGWTPPGKLPNSAFTGNATKDMASQLPLIKKFVEDNPPDPERVRAMYNDKTVEAAANHWGVGIERFGINDVHSEGVALAKQIMNSYGNGGSTKKGAAQPGQKKASLANSKKLYQGGWLSEPITGFGHRSGIQYELAERGPEYISPTPGARSGGGGNNYYSIAVNCGVGDKAEIGKEVVGTITAYERRQGRRGDNAVFNK